jgi:hypothetical protein
MKTIIFLFLVLLNFSSFSQENSDSKKANKHKLFNVKRTGLYGAFGWAFSDYAAVNKILSDSGYRKFNTNQFSKGFGFTARTNKVIANLDYHLLTQCNVSDYDFCSHIDFVSYGLSFGYDVTKKEKLDFYPFIGVNRNRTDILLSYVEWPEMPVSTFLNNVSNIARMTRVNYSLNIGAGFDYFIPLGSEISSEIILGLQAGYYAQLTESTWFIHVDELPLTNAPKTNPGGAYIKAVLGICF